MGFRQAGLLLAAAFGIASSPAAAKVTTAQAAMLNSSLTPMGAERAGNQDGTIPAWTGGMSELPAGVSADTKRMPDFHSGDKKLLTIDSSNADQYAAKLSTGTLYILKHYPGYKIEVYPTHRDAAAPKWFYDATFKNATTAEISDVNWVVNAKSGIPFPIPQTGKELIWDTNLNWAGVQTRAQASTFVVPPGSSPLLNGVTLDQRWHPYADPNYTSGLLSGYYLLARENTVGPPNRVGNAILGYQSYNEDTTPQITWQYLVGQRRLRKAPQVTYDGTYPDCGGITTVDELTLFNGAPDRYNISIVGKRELYVPYDNNGTGFVSGSSLIGPNFLNPDDIRWELHRVWVADMTVAPGKRHQLPHRVLYIDEDTWSPLLSDDYDSNKNLAKIGQALMYTNPAFPGTFALQNVIYETGGSGYCWLNDDSTDSPANYLYTPVHPPYPPSFFSPDTVASESLR